MRWTKPPPASARRSIQNANIILGATFDSSLDGQIRVSVVATGIDYVASEHVQPARPTVAVTTSKPQLQRRSLRPLLATESAENSLAALTQRMKREHQASG